MSRLCHALVLIGALCTACSSDDSATDQSNGSPNGGNNSGGSGGSAQGAFGGTIKSYYGFGAANAKVVVNSQVTTVNSDGSFVFEGIAASPSSPLDVTVVCYKVPDVHTETDFCTPDLEVDRTGKHYSVAIAHVTGVVTSDLTVVLPANWIGEWNTGLNIEVGDFEAPETVALAVEGQNVYSFVPLIQSPVSSSPLFWGMTRNFEGTLWAVYYEREKEIVGEQVRYSPTSYLGYASVPLTLEHDPSAMNNAAIPNTADIAGTATITAKIVGDPGVVPSDVALRSGPSILASAVLGYSSISEDMTGEISFVAPVIDGWINGITASRGYVENDIKYTASGLYFSEDSSKLFSVRLPDSPLVQPIGVNLNELTFSWKKDVPSGATSRTVSAALNTTDGGKDWTLYYYVVTQGDHTSVTIPDLSTLGLPSLTAVDGTVSVGAYSPTSIDEILTNDVHGVYDETVWRSWCDRPAK